MTNDFQDDFQDDFQEYLDKKFHEIPKPFLAGCVEFLKGYIPEVDVIAIRERYNEVGSNWIGIEHHFWGMTIRNVLREAGYKDEVLPDKNWDDYYTQVVEVAVGIRNMEGEIVI